MPTQRDIEQLLRNVPLATQADESRAADMLQIFIDLRNAAFSGVGLEVPGMNSLFSIPALINDMKAGNYTDVALTLIGVGGDAAGAFSFLVTAATEAGAIAGTSALASAGVVAGFVAEAAGPASIAAATLVATFRIPSTVSENNSKLYFLSDASGILTSWMFNMPEISPHTRLTRQARTGGYARTDVSDQCRLAHQRVHQLWTSNYQGNAAAQRQAKESAGNDWQRYWLQVGGAMEQRLRPSPTGLGQSWIRRIIRDLNASARRRAFEAGQRRLAQRQRAAAGGYWFRCPDGVELFMPDR